MSNILPLAPVFIWDRSAKWISLEKIIQTTRRVPRRRVAAPHEFIGYDANVATLDLSPRTFRTRFGGLFLFLPAAIGDWLDVEDLAVAPKPRFSPSLSRGPPTA